MEPQFYRYTALGAERPDQEVGYNATRRPQMSVKHDSAEATLHLVTG
ncbi:MULTISPECIES: hypothetical protein [Microbispora]|uniref:Uncharacterized protein n=1 Tax=Microbispora amethystogenes TaxID=1427754 RepID=A0ABQ4F8F3_9ACTN|nr:MULTISPECIES: hypothetical protein [Microbispora]GIH31090.1 hypothetical protein Mam01_12540 [Microbispora amethystogenes]